MPAHERQQIRAYVAALLVGKTVAADRVFKTRVDPFRLKELPAIAVYSFEETVDQERSDTAPRELTRDLKLDIQGWVLPGDGFDDRMDDLALQIENVMDIDPFLGVLAADSILEATAFTWRTEGERTAGQITLTYAVTYRTLLRTLAGDELDDFLKADTKYPPNDAPLDANTPEDNFHTRTTP